MYQNIPNELKQLKQWCCWKLEERTDKKTGEVRITKIPKSAFGNYNSMSNNPKSWGTFEQACANEKKNNFDGIGFFFLDGYFGVDLDKCIENKDFVDEFVNTLDSYTEYSQSKTGVHIICKGKLPEGGRRKGIVEMYENGRFFVMTGNVYNNKNQINERTEEIKSLHEKYIGKKQVKKQQNKPTSTLDLSEQDILKIAFSSKNGKEIESLYRGVFSSYPSQSEADLALCNHLAFYAQGDFDKVDRLFRSSGLMRDKWEEMRGITTYGQRVINEAIDGCTSFFIPREKKNSIDNNDVELKEEDYAQYPFSENVYKYIISFQNEIKRTEVKQKFLSIAKKLGHATDFNQMITAYIKENPIKKQDFSNVTDFGIENELFCGGWIANKDGIKIEVDKGFNRASHTPIYPIKLMRNQQTKEQKCKIGFIDKGKTHELFVDKEMLLIASKIVSLSKYGVLVTSETARHLVSFFSEIFSRNTFIEQPSTSKMGWCENNTAFLPLTESRIEIDTHVSFSSLVDSLKPTGNKDKYLEFIKKLMIGSRKEIKLAILASLSSVLIAPLGALPYIVHIYGQAGIGKTLLTKLCAGIWGKPQENGFLIDPKNTATSFEVLLNLLNHLPFIADDINKLNQNNMFFTQRDLIYLLGGGSGKQRSNTNLTISEVRTWQNVSILNGEKSLTTEDSHGGELLRTIELQLEPKNLFQHGSETADFLHNNYGFLGREFVEWILKYGQIEQAKISKKEFSEEIERIYGDKKEGKQIESVGVLYATQEILCGMLGVQRTLEIEDFASLIKNVDDVLDTQRAYEKICNIILQNSSCFLFRDKVLEKGDKEPSVKWGWFYEDEYFIIPTQFSKLCKDVNIDRKLFIEWAIEKNIIEHQKGRNDGTKISLIKEQNRRIRIVQMKILRENE